MNKRITLLALVIFSTMNYVKAQISITNSTPYTQDFNTLPTSGILGTNPTPANWFRFANPTSAIGDTIRVTAGSTTSGGFYSVGTGTDADRAFGLLLSSATRPLYLGAKFINNTGSTIVSANVSYKCEQWRRGNTNAGKPDSLLFEYNVGTDSVYKGTWTNVSQLMATSVNTSGTASALDGNAVNVTKTHTITGLAISNGSTFWIRFNDYDNVGSEDMLSVDDFSISFTTGTVAACTEPANSVTNVVANQTGLTSIAGSFTATTADAYLVLLDSNATVPTITDATTYSVGQTVGTATVISNGTSTSFSRSGLVSNTTYYVYVFPYNNVSCINGPNYKTSAPGNDTAKTLVDACPEPSAKPTNLVFTLVNNNNINGKFNKAVPAPTGGYVVVYSTSSSVGYPNDTISYAVGDSIKNGSARSKVAYVGTDSNFAISGLQSGTRYYLAVVPFNTCGYGPNYFRTTPLRGDTITSGTPPPTDCASPTGVSNTSITLDSTANSITVKFTFPANADSVMILAAPIAVGTINVRDTAYYLVGATIPSSTSTPATVYYRGTGDSMVITGLNPNTVYKVFIATFKNVNCINGPNYSGLATKTVRTAVATSIRTKNSEAAFSIYPNPTHTGLLFVKFDKALREEATLEVIDILGRKLSSQNISNGSELQTVNVSNLAKGTYILNIVYKGSNNVSTFIVE